MKRLNVVLISAFACLLTNFSGAVESGNVPVFIEFKQDDDSKISIRSREIEAVWCDKDHLIILTATRTYRFRPANDTTGLVTCDVYADIIRNYLENGPAVFDKDLSAHLMKTMEDKTQPFLERKLAAMRFWRTVTFFVVNEITVTDLNKR